MTLIRFKIPTTINCISFDEEKKPLLKKKEYKNGDEVDVTIFDDADGIMIGVDFSDGSNSFFRKDIVEIEGADFPWKL